MKNFNVVIFVFLSLFGLSFEGNAAVVNVSFSTLSDVLKPDLDKTFVFDDKNLKRDRFVFRIGGQDVGNTFTFNDVKGEIGFYKIQRWNNRLQRWVNVRRGGDLNSLTLKFSQRGKYRLVVNDWNRKSESSLLRVFLDNPVPLVLNNIPSVPGTTPSTPLPAPVPVPAPIFLLLSAILGMVFFKRREDWAVLQKV